MQNLLKYDTERAKDKQKNWTSLKKKVYASKDTIKKVKRQEQENIFTNHISDKGLVSRIHKELNNF